MRRASPIRTTWYVAFSGSVPPDSHPLRRERGDGSGHKRRQTGLGDREEEEEELLGPRGAGFVGAALSQPPDVLQEMVFGRDCSGEAGSGAAGEGGIGDDGRGKGWKDKREGSLEVTAPSSVGEGRCNGHRDTLPSEWMAYLLAPKLGVSISACQLLLGQPRPRL